MTGADLIVRRLLDHGVRNIFGYPGGQLTPLYDALQREGNIRHILARDEQAAAFMADGFARSTGRPGICLAVCGPGVGNAITPLASAFTDSIPILMISGQIPRGGRGTRSGYYHENDQQSVCASCTKLRLRVETPGELLPALHRAFVEMTVGRPGPVLFEVPVDVLRAEATAEAWPPMPALPAPAALASGEIDALARLLTTWQRPLLLAGGGLLSADASTALRDLAERLGAPVFHTAMGKSAMPGDHPLAAGMPWKRATSDLSAMDGNFSPLFAQADGLLAVGCRFTQLTTGTWTLKLPASVAQIDIDPVELGRHYRLQAAVRGDARSALEALLTRLPPDRREPWVTVPTRGEPWTLGGLDLVTPLRRALPPEGIVVADITRLAYILMVELPVYQPRTFLHPAGYVPMGYGIPAALGARIAHPKRPVVAVVGDGCFAMCAMELATAVQEKLPIVVVLVNDGSLTLIKAIQQRRYEQRYLGVDLLNPDFSLFAQSFGVKYASANTESAFEDALREALRRDETTLLEVRVPGV